MKKKKRRPCCLPRADCGLCGMRVGDWVTEKALEQCLGPRLNTRRNQHPLDAFHTFCYRYPHMDEMVLMKPALFWRYMKSTSFV